MKDKKEIYLNLEPLTEEQIKGLVPIIEGAGDEIAPITRNELLERDLKKDIYLQIGVRVWVNTDTRLDKEEITYTEFLELFGKTKQLEDVAENATSERKITLTIEDSGGIITLGTPKANFHFDMHKHEGFYDFITTAEDITDSFVFPKAKEGDFPDLSGFGGVPMLCGYGVIETSWDKENVVCKLLDGFSSIQDGSVYFPDLVKPLPTNQTLTYQQLVEKIGLERACELAGVELSEIEIK